VSFTGVTATWNGLHVTSPPNFTTLGPYYFTQYNSIYESTCTGSKATAFVFTGTGSCAYNLLTGANGLASNFISQVTLNGTGVSANPAVGLIAGFRGTGLFGLCPWPPGSNQGLQSANVFVQIPAVQGSCNQQLVSGSFAVNPNPALSAAGTGQWNCSDKVSLLNNGSNASSLGTIYPVQDYCPACSNYPAGTTGHIDVFSTSQACSNVGNFSANPISGVRLR